MASVGGGGGLAFVALSGRRGKGAARTSQSFDTWWGFFLRALGQVSSQVGPGVSPALGGLSWCQSQSYLWGQAPNKATRCSLTRTS